MKLKDKAKPVTPPLESGVYMAVCVTIADLGKQYSERYKTISPKTLFAFDIPSETILVNGEEKPRQLSKRCTSSYSNKSTLYKMVNAWLNTNMNEQTLSEFELYDLIGCGCQIRVTVAEDGVHNNIEDVMALPKGMPVPVSDTPPIKYDIDEDGFSGSRWDALPDWLRNIIKKSEQYQQNPPDQTLDMPEIPDEQEGDCPI